jgi:hypothetical protein
MENLYLAKVGDKSNKREALGAFPEIRIHDPNSARNGDSISGQT